MHGWKDKALFTPGPLTTSRTVKQAMLRDLGSRDFEFIEIVRDIRRRLVEIGDGGTEYEAVLVQGSGTYSVESVLSSTVPRGGKVLVVINGAYGKRIAQMAEVLGIDHVRLEFPEHETCDPAAVAAALRRAKNISQVVVVHCETTTGVINSIEEIGAAVRESGAHYFVDAMSSFGAIPISLPKAKIDYLVSSANKCIEGVPGFGFVLARREALQETQGYARSLSLDLFAQWKGLEANGQFRFTPPTHVLLAFHRALLELEEEGGPEGRARRYRENHETVVRGMRALGFREYLAPEKQGYIITSFRYPEHPSFDFETFYRKLNDRGHVIYPGKVSDADCFRIGHIGRLFRADMEAMLYAVREVLSEMGIVLRPAQ